MSVRLYSFRYESKNISDNLYFFISYMKCRAFARKLHLTALRPLGPRGSSAPSGPDAGKRCTGLSKMREAKLDVDSLTKLYFQFLSNWMGCDRGDGFSFDYESNRIQLGSVRQRTEWFCPSPQFTKAYTEKTIFPIPFTLNRIWTWWRFFFRFWTE